MEENKNNTMSRNSSLIDEPTTGCKNLDNNRYYSASTLLLDSSINSFRAPKALILEVPLTVSLNGY